MSAPSTPGLSLTANSPAAGDFTASITADAGTTTSVYYRPVGGAVDTLAGTVSGSSGSVQVTGLNVVGNYLVYAVSNSAAGGNSLPVIGQVSLAQTDTVSGAIVAAFLAQPTVTALCPSIWLNEVPEEDQYGNVVPLPVARVEVPKEASDWNFETAHTDTCDATVYIYAHTAALADQIATAFAGATDWQPLPFLTETCVQFMRTESRIGAEDLLDRDDNRVFERVIQYQVMVTRQGAVV